MATNPLISGKTVGKYEAFPLDELKKEHFLPAIKKALKEAKQNIQKIRENKEEANFDNTILALETASENLDNITTLYYNLMGMESDDEFKSLAQEISPLLSDFKNEIMTDPILFDRVKKVYKDSEKLNSEQKRLVELNYKSFTRNGALLDDEKKKELRKIDMELSKLSPKFAQNVLASTNSFQLHITDKKELEGIPESALEAAEDTAEKKGYDSGWLFTLQMPSLLPVLKFAENRNLREKMNRAFGSRAYKDKFDNCDILKKIASLRYTRAKLLGFKNHAEYVLKERMAETPEKVEEFLDRIKNAAKPVALKEVKELKKLAKERDNISDFQVWDSAFYSEKLKKKKYDFDEEKLRPYFKMENVVDGLFKVANKLYGVNFQKNNDIPVYHEDVQVFEVKDDKDSFVGLLYVDLFPRETKRSGAWMTTFRTQGLHNGEIKRPHAAVVANLTPSTKKKPSLLNLNEVTTLFHEFGHSLHALLSDCTYASLASPNVYWDFVELPSQIMENWVTEPEALELFAKHYETGEVIPKKMIEKIKKIRKYHAGMNNLRQIQLGLIDMAWHDKDPSNIEDVGKFEDEVVEDTRLYPKVDGKNTSASFAHIFAGGYSAGYYSYKWAEVLEADAFELFKENGIFDRKTARSFRENILARGNTDHPMNIYVKFRGRKPDPDAMLKKFGLLEK